MIKMLERKKEDLLEQIEFYQDEIEKVKAQIDMIDDLIDEVEEQEEADRKEREQSVANI